MVAHCRPRRACVAGCHWQSSQHVVFVQCPDNLCQHLREANTWKKELPGCINDEPPSVHTVGINRLVGSHHVDSNMHIMLMIDIKLLKILDIIAFVNNEYYE